GLAGHGHRAARRVRAARGAGDLERGDRIGTAGTGGDEREGDGCPHARRACNAGAAHSFAIFKHLAETRRRAEKRLWSGAKVVTAHGRMRSNVRGLVYGWDVILERFERLAAIRGDAVRGLPVTAWAANLDDLDREQLMRAAIEVVRSLVLPEWESK